MPTPGLTSVDAEGLMVTWLNTLTASLVGNTRPINRGFFFELQRSPGKDSYAVLTRIGGLDGYGAEAPADMARLSCSIFSTTKVAAAAGAVAYANALRTLSTLKPIIEGTRIRLADNVTGPLWVPNPLKTAPQYLVDADIYFEQTT
jgi:hypothetical protein